MDILGLRVKKSMIPEGIPEGILYSSYKKISIFK